MRLKISLIITTYNRPDYLRKVLEGVLLQRPLPFEILVADDGSDEGTKKVVEEFRIMAPCPLVHVWQEDRGFRLAKIRNEAIKNAAGDYLIFLDGDCVPCRSFIADHIALAEKGCFFQGKRMLLKSGASADLDASRSGEIFFLLGLVLRGGVSNCHHILRLPFFPALKSRDLKGMRGCNMGFYREDLLAVNGFNQDFVGWGREDSELAVRLYRYGLKRRTHPFMAICLHLWHEENTRDRLGVNDELLRGAISSGSYRCRNGINELS